MADTTAEAPATESAPATDATASDSVSFADLQHEMGAANVALVAALRVSLGIKKTDVATAMVSRADVKAALEALDGRPAKWDKKSADDKKKAQA